MSQHDFDISNQSFPATRSDLNNALKALASNSLGDTAPSTTYAGQWWFDQNDNTLYLRNKDNDAWVSIAYIDPTTDEWQLWGSGVRATNTSGLALKTNDGSTGAYLHNNSKFTVGSNTASLYGSQLRVGAGIEDHGSQFNVSNATYQMVNRAASSEWVFYNNSAGNIPFHIAPTEVVLNQSGNDVDLRVESDTNAYAFFVDASTTLSAFGTTPTANKGIVQIHGGGGSDSSLGFVHNDNATIASRYSLILQCDSGGTVSGRTIDFKAGGDGYATGTSLGYFNSSGYFAFNSGYGSPSVAYGTRAWVNFNGTGTVAIRNSGGVSSITDNGTGNYTINLSFTMPDTHYTMVATCSGAGTGQLIGVDASSVPTKTTTSVSAIFGRASGTYNIYDPSLVDVMIVR